MHESRTTKLELVPQDLRENTPAEVRLPGRGWSTLMRAVNVRVRSLSADLGDTEPVAFFCECELATCFTALWMTNSQFDDAVKAGDTWLLATGHRLSTLPPQQPVASALDHAPKLSAA